LDWIGRIYLKEKARPKPVEHVRRQ